ncbi:MAG: porin [Cytophagaceae bacterium]|nr:porin [Cytophagaceae bacterium]
MKKVVLFAVALATAPATILAQTIDTTMVPATPSTTTANSMILTGYADVYYTQDFTAPKTTQERPGFLYNHKRNREVNVNLAYLKGAYSTERVRGNLAIMVGNYAQYNLSAEQDLIKNIYEANAGVKLSKNRELWLDAGIFTSHIGFESAISKDCWTLTRSIVAENSPYYLAGAKLSYTTPNGKWVLLGSVVNGWQRIKRFDGYSGASLSTQIQYKPSSKVTLNWSTFFGSDRPDSLKSGRMYHNFYGIFQPGKLGLILGFDIGADRKPVLEGRRVGSGSYVWYTPVAILRYSANDRINLAGRIEYYDDPNGVIIATGTRNGFKTWGYSVNFDYAITSQALFRIEGKLYDSKDAIFETTTGVSRVNTSLTTGLAISF